MTKKHKHTILLVDDEPSILSALKRLLRRDGYRILTAGDGEEGLEVLQLANGQNPVSLIVSDQRMPGMSGAQFLEKSIALAPDAIRFLLTGYSDMKSLEEAVNKGEIQRYLTKPWDDDDIRTKIRSSLEQAELVLENKRLQEVTRRQNRQLMEISQALDRRVKEQTGEVRDQHRQVVALNKQLEESIRATVRFMTALVENIKPDLGRYMRKSAQMARQLGKVMELSDETVDNIELAASLHDIGLIGMPESIWYKDEEKMSPDEFRLFSQHPVTAAITIESVQRLEDVAEIILYHHENVDGSGFPNGLKGDDIPLGARILAVASDYCRVLHTWPDDPKEIVSVAENYLGKSMARDLYVEDPQVMKQEAAGKLMMSKAGKRYDLLVVSSLLRAISDGYFVEAKGIQKLSVDQLEEGMELIRDLNLKDGRLLLAKGTVLRDSLLTSIKRVTAQMSPDEKIMVRLPGSSP